MAVTWPDTLPAPMARGIEIVPRDTSRHYAFDAGNTRKVSRCTTKPHIIKCNFFFDAAQYQAFDYFFKFTCNFGVNWFQASWLGAIGFDDHMCRFLAQPKEQKRGGWFIVTSVLEAFISLSAIPPISDLHEPSNLGNTGIPTDGMRFWMAADQWVMGINPPAGTAWLPIQSLHDENVFFDLYSSDHGGIGFSWLHGNYGGFDVIRVAPGGLSSFFLKKETLSHATNGLTVALVLNMADPSISAGFIGGSIGVGYRMYRVYYSTQKDIHYLLCNNASGSQDSNMTAFLTNPRVVVVLTIPALIGQEVVVRYNKSENLRHALLSLSTRTFAIETFGATKSSAIHEVMVWDRVLDAAEISTVENEMSGKWQIE